MLSQSMENYVKTVYELQQEATWVSTSALAERLSHAPASVTNMVKKLAEPNLNLLKYKPYQGVRLTQVGEKVALEIIRHHRLVELYLAEVMGIPWDEVHAEAERIEHIISEDVEDRMAAALGNPTIDPHGSPIPAKNGAMIDREVCALADVEIGRSATVAEVADEDPKLLRYLGELSIYPGTIITLLDREPFGGPLKIQLEGRETPQSVGQEVAKMIFVILVGAAEKRPHPDPRQRGR
jgi:DtxR family Mn-dependent transcriptional regulator